MGEVPEEKPNITPAEDSIQVVARFRPLNTTEEKTGSKFVVSFPASKGQDDQFVTIGVSYSFMQFCFVVAYLVNLIYLVRKFYICSCPHNGTYIQI